MESACDWQFLPDINLAEEKAASTSRRQLSRVALQAGCLQPFCDVMHQSYPLLEGSFHKDFQRDKAKEEQGKTTKAMSWNCDATGFDERV